MNLRMRRQQPSNLTLEEERQLKAAVLSLKRESTLIPPEMTAEEQAEDLARLQKLKARSNSHLRQQGLGRTTKRMVSFPQLRPRTSSNSGDSRPRQGEPSLEQPSIYGTPSNKVRLFSLAFFSLSQRVSAQGSAFLFFFFTQSTVSL
jgi:hypothetical protein